MFRNGRKNNPGEVVIQSENGERRVLRSTPDWTEEAINGDHLWVPTSASGDLCHVLDQDCTVSPQFLFPVLLLFASLIVRQSTNRNVFNYKSFSNYLPSFFKDFIVADDFGSKPSLCMQFTVDLLFSLTILLCNQISSEFEKPWPKPFV